MTLEQVRRWLVRHDQSHILKCGWSIVVEDDNEDLNDPIWDGLQRLGFPVSDPGEVTTGEVTAVQSRRLRAFLLACRFYLLERVLAHYRSQATQGILNNRIEFNKRAEGLAEDLYGKDRKGGLREELEDELIFGLQGGVLVGERLTYTNIPDAVCIPRVR